MKYTDMFDTYVKQYSLALFGGILGLSIAVILGYYEKVVVSHRSSHICDYADYDEWCAY